MKLALGKAGRPNYDLSFSSLGENNNGLKDIYFDLPYYKTITA